MTGSEITVLGGPSHIGNLDQLQGLQYRYQLGWRFYTFAVFLFPHQGPGQPTVAEEVGNSLSLKLACTMEDG